MQKEEVSIKTEYIKLDQFLKWVGLVSTGAEAKSFIELNDIYVQQEIEKRRGRKLYKGYNIVINEKLYIIV